MGRLFAAATPSGDQRLIGRIVSITPSSGGYLLRFDPVWFLSGVTANVAQAEDQATTCAPLSCPPVPNDNYRVDEAHRAFTFLLRGSTRGTVLVRNAQNGGPSRRRRSRRPLSRASRPGGAR